MSNIIKGGQVRSQGIINLAERAPKEIEYVTNYTGEVDGLMPEQLMEGALEEASPSLEEQKQLLQALEQEAQDKIDRAKEAAETIITEAMHKAEQLSEKARQEQLMVLSQTQAEKERILEEANRQAEEIKDAALVQKEELLQGVEGEVVETMITLLGHIISEELNYHTQWLGLVVRKMLHKQNLGEALILYVSPTMRQQIEDQEEQLLASLKNVTAIKEDETLSDTACRLVTDEGSIEYDVLEGMEQVVAELRIMKGLA